MCPEVRTRWRGSVAEIVSSSFLPSSLRPHFALASSCVITGSESTPSSISGIAGVGGALLIVMPMPGSANALGPSSPARIGAGGTTPPPVGLPARDEVMDRAEEPCPDCCGEVCLDAGWDRETDELRRSGPRRCRASVSAAVALSSAGACDGSCGASDMVHRSRGQDAEIASADE